MLVKRSYNFGPDQVESIDSLSRELGIDKTNVLMNGLRLLRVAVREAKQGNRIGVVASGSVVHELIGPWNDVREQRP